MTKRALEEIQAQSRLRLVRSDQGDGGWSLHMPAATDDEIANGDEPPLLSGTARLIDGEWDRPAVGDYVKAQRLVKARTRADADAELKSW